MENLLLYFGGALLVLSIVASIRNYFVIKKQVYYEGVVVKVKNKSKQGRIYCYPKVAVMDNDIETIISCPSVKKNGHDQFTNGDIITMFKFKNFLFQNTYASVEGFGSISKFIGVFGLTMIIMTLLLK